MKPIIKVENVSKQYRLGIIGTGTLRNDFKRWSYRLRGKEDPFLKIGESNDRSTKGSSDYVWALKDISFDVMPGEVLGVVGKNGAGKSTLLKILSKVTGPTTGRIDYDGRIGSLLEVGTGFHPELTGRENIFLNGAILGMTKSEIRSKLDEIIDFSGCERYIDTPVKRYSSGMTVRLGFAVAAHLEPEILVVDEVLAVGDAEFQKKAIGKMQDVSKNDGRTVLFVSHNMSAVRDLCGNSVILENGRLTASGSTQDIIEQYLTYTAKQKSNMESNHIRVKYISFDQSPVVSNERIAFNLEIESEKEEVINSMGLFFNNQFEQRVAVIDLRSHDKSYALYPGQTLSLQGEVDRLMLVEGTYKVGIFVGGNYLFDHINDLMTVNVVNRNERLLNYPVETRGYVDVQSSLLYEIK